jgi:CxxC motif-containing protein (DUF1111 family)
MKRNGLSSLKKLVLILGLLFLTMGACDLMYPDEPAREVRINRPMPNLTHDQMGIHVKGQEAFNQSFSPEEGLGPIFIATACSACHPGDAQGHLVFNLARFGKMEGGRFDPMEEKGGPQLQNRAIPGFEPEVMPEDISGTAQFTAPIVGGLGLLESVDDQQILNLADPNDLDGDGISGRPQMIEATPFLDRIAAFENDSDTRFIKHNGFYLGRFGRKASNISLRLQTVSAFKQDMGLSTDLMPDDLFNVQRTGVSGYDDVADPEISSAMVDQITFFLKTLRPPERRNLNDPDVQEGERIFTRIGCASCHIPTLTTGANSVEQISHRVIHPYTDLLLHDMGDELNDQYTEGNATLAEWRTAPLWGLGLAERFQGGSPFYLHDGRARSLTEAILYHGGEASASRSEFMRLKPNEKDQLMSFLKSL